MNPRTKRAFIPAIFLALSLAWMGCDKPAEKTPANPADKTTGAPAASSPPEPARAVQLPFSIYAEAGDPQTFIPSGWMGDTKFIRIQAGNTVQPQSGKTAMRCEFASPKGWGSVVWQTPTNDWGDKGVGFDMTGAQKVTFWARGEKGGEEVSFKFGLIGKGKKYHDTAKGALESVKLSTEWRWYGIPASGDLSRIKTGFSWVVFAKGAPVVFYIDDVRWE